MQKKYFILVTLFAVIQGCGRPKVKTIQDPRVEKYFASLQNCQKSQNLNLFEEIEEYFKSYEMNLILTNGLAQANEMLKSQSEKGFFSPIEINHDMLKLRLNQIKEMPEATIDELRSKSIEIAILKNLSNRFQSVGCDIKARTEADFVHYEDFRPFLRLLHQEALSDSTQQEDYLKICKKLDAQKLCEKEISETDVELRMKHIQDRVNQFSENVFMPYYNRRISHNQFLCRDNEMIVKIKMDPALASLMNSKLQIVSKLWSSEETEKFNVRFEVAKENEKADVILEWKKEGVSHSDGNNKIVLNSLLNPGQLAIVLAHEMGHIFGFPDCYEEFWDQEKQQYVYYELGGKSGNIMCSIMNGNRIPNRYKIELRQRACR